MRTKSSMRLRKEHRAEVQHLLMLKRHHLELAASMQARLEGLLRVGYGVDVARDNWELDVERGILSRKHKELEQDVACEPAQ